MPDLKTVTFDASQWQLVPKEPTEDMVTAGFESRPDKYFSAPEVWEAFEKLSGCQQAAHKATLCYRAMLEHAPTPAAQSAGQEAALPSWWPDFIQNVCELPDRNSPEDEPDAMVATAQELESCALAAIETASGASEPVTDAEEAEALRAFDRSKTQGFSYDLESYCAGYIDCEGKPAPQNNPCAVCGKRAADAQQACSPFKCEAAQRDGVLCADDECDRANGVRSADAQQVGGEFDSEADALVAAIMEEVRARPTASNAYGLNMKAKIKGAIVSALQRAALTSPAKVGGDERDAFEAAMKAKGKSVARAAEEYGGAYRFVEPQWEGWQARAALSADGGDRKDAERYRWLRDSVDSGGVLSSMKDGVLSLNPKNADEAIDAAIATKAKGE